MGRVPAALGGLVLLVALLALARGWNARNRRRSGTHDRDVDALAHRNNMVELRGRRGAR